MNFLSFSDFIHGRRKSTVYCRRPQGLDLAKEWVNCTDQFKHSSTSSNGRNLSHDNGFHCGEGFSHLQIEPTLGLGFENMAGLLNPLPVQINPRSFQHYNYKPQIYGSREFKRSSKMVNEINKRSVRAPKMRWTCTLRAYFVHAVELLGGNKRTKCGIRVDEC